MPLPALLLPAIISAAGSLGSAYLGSKNQSGGAGGFLTPTNPASATLNRLFGRRLHRHRSGDDAGTYSLVRDRKNPGIFGEQFDAALQDFMFNPLLPSQGEQSFIQGLLDSAPDRLEGILGQLSGLQQLTSDRFGQARGAVQDLLSTGFQTDAQPFYDTAISNFQRNVLPAIAERVGAFGGGIQSTGFQNLAGREAANLLDEAARANVALAESANVRRAGAVPLLGPLAGQESSLLASLLGTQAALPGAFGQDVLNLGTGFRNVFEAGRARPLDVFTQLAGLGGPGANPLMLQGFSPQGSATADVLSALTSNAGNIASVLQNLPGLPGLGNIFGPGGSAATSPAITI